MDDNNMRRLAFAHLLLSFLTLTTIGCSPKETRESAPPAVADGIATEVDEKQGDEIVFRGRYYEFKGCPPSAPGALGLWPACAVLEVIHGQLKLTDLIGPELPIDVQKGETYTFRWKLSENHKKVVREAESGGHTIMWVQGQQLDFAIPQRPAQKP